jgi:light-regulated signal transduction histidine kinase (bacteriophytochrome)
MFGADFGFLVIKGEARTIGRLFAYTECIALLQYIRQRASTSIFYTHAIEQDCPDFDYAPGLAQISGMLVIPLALSGTDFLVFLRKGKLKEINWAGNPYEKLVNPGTSYLEPRSSFKRWSELVVGTSREWTEDEGLFINASQQRQRHLQMQWNPPRYCLHFMADLLRSGDRRKPSSSGTD